MALHTYGLLPEDVALDLNHLENLDKETIDKLIDAGNAFGEIFSEAARKSPDGKISGHYWHGIGKTSFTSREAGQLQQQLQAWNDTLTVLQNLHAQWRQLFNQDFESLAPEDAQHLQQVLRQLPPLQGNERFDVDFAALAAQHEAFAAFLQAYEACHEQQNALRGLLTAEAIENPETASAVQSAIERLTDVFPDSICLQEIVRCQSVAEKVLKTGNFLRERMETIKRNVPDEIKQLLDVTPDGFWEPEDFAKFEELKRFTGFIGQLPPHLWQYRHDAFSDSGIDAVLNKQNQLIVNLKGLQKNLETCFNLNNLPDAAQLRRHIDTLEQDGAFSFFSSQWRASRNSIAALLLDRKTSWKEIRESLSDLLLYREKLDELHHIQKNSPLPDGLKLGIGIPIIGLIGLRNWYRQVNKDYYGLLNGNAGLARALFTIDPNLARAIRDVFLKELQQPINDVMQNTAILHDLMELDDEELLSVPILAQTISQHLPILEKMVVNPADSLENLSRSLQGLRQLTEKAEHLAQQKAGFSFCRRNGVLRNNSTQRKSSRPKTRWHYGLPCNCIQ